MAERSGGVAPAGDPSRIHVVATAGHVDHGKSSLLLRLTGTDPDRLEEEKRRGLTIDLGFAWCTLPSGREVGFVDVPGHERFIRTMLAGVGPVRLVLFVVAADEGWKPQSEEHLGILDVLAVDASVIAMTKTDLVDHETLELAQSEVRDRVAATALEDAPIVACSSATGEGIDELTAALDAMVAAAPEPERLDRTRLHVDRVFAIAGAGTVVTGTLTGGALAAGDDVVLLPRGVRARVRGLQTHKRRLERASPISRVAVNLVGADRTRIGRGDVLVHEADWRPTAAFEVALSPVRGLSRELSGRGAYKIYAGAAERNARVRIYGGGRLVSGGRVFARIGVAEPVVLAFGDRFVVRDAGRDDTVAGGVVLDAHPPRRAGPEPRARLAARERIAPGDRRALAVLAVRERGAIGADELREVVGASVAEVPGAVRSGAWWIDRTLLERAAAAASEAARAHHASHPLEPGVAVTAIRAAIASAVGRSVDPALDALVEGVVASGSLVREAALLRLPGHRPADAARAPELERVAEAVASAGATPPTVRDLVAAGHQASVIDAAVRAGVLVRVAPELVFSPAVVDRAVEVIRSAGAEGMTVSALRERLGTSRRYAVPLLEHLDARGLTIRRGDVRIARGVRA